MADINELLAKLNQDELEKYSDLINEFSAIMYEQKIICQADIDVEKHRIAELKAENQRLREAVVVANEYMNRYMYDEAHDALQEALGGGDDTDVGSYF